jgi:hypothetical protein
MNLAELFANAYAKRHGLQILIQINQRIYGLSEVSAEIPPLTLPLSMRTATVKDASFLPWWWHDFSLNGGTIVETLADSAERINSVLNQGGLYILEDNGVAVSMVRVHREMKTVCGIGPVYTPPFLRNRGYATASVAEVSRLALQRGFKTCVLYTDLANPISNSIYQKIGYKPICDSMMFRFEKFERI